MPWRWRGEYSPKRSRVTLMMLVSCGFTAGAVLGGLLSAAMISRFGWRSVFYLGALAMALLMSRYLPESLQFMVLKGHKLDQVAGTLRRIVPGFSADSDTRYLAADITRGGVPAGDLFRHGRAAVTALLWLVNFMNLLNLYFLSN